LRNLPHDYEGTEGDNENSNDGVGQRQEVLDLQFSGGRDTKRTEEINKIRWLLTQEVVSRIIENWDRDEPPNTYICA
jgi:hypothetical protein